MIASRTVEYGLLALSYFAKHKDKKIVPSYTITKEYGITSEEYFLKVMNDLVKANILKSLRGTNGGYSLARPLNKINMLEVIEAIDGPFESRLNVSGYSKDKFCVKADKAHQKAIAEARKVLKNTTLSNLI
jgi:Rrf2 family protein